MSPAAARAQSLTEHFTQRLVEGAAYDSIVQARAEASEVLGQPVRSGTPLAKQTEEAIEAGLVRAAQQIVVRSRSDPLLVFDQLVDLYERQPNLATRSSTSIRNQAYSTPIPVGFVAATLAGIDEQTTVYEPTAGHSALLLGASKENVVCNEIDAVRADDLKRQGYRVTTEDAILYRPLVLVNAVVMNPPPLAQPQTPPMAFPTAGQALLRAKYLDITESLEQQPMLMPSSEQALQFLQLNGQEGPTQLKSQDEHLLVHLNRETLFLNIERSKQRAVDITWMKTCWKQLRQSLFQPARQ